MWRVVARQQVVASLLVCARKLSRHEHASGHRWRRGPRGHNSACASASRRGDGESHEWTARAIGQLARVCAMRRVGRRGHKCEEGDGERACQLAHTTCPTTNANMPRSARHKRGRGTFRCQSPLVARLSSIHTRVWNNSNSDERVGVTNGEFDTRSMSPAATWPRQGAPVRLQVAAWRRGRDRTRHRVSTSRVGALARTEKHHCGAQDRRLLSQHLPHHHHHKQLAQLVPAALC